ncbi:MAG TPA: hypothetical protein VEG39_07845 [Clostridia bacterium]|nr:hypothetical protein [Clostridia bacterium]
MCTSFAAYLGKPLYGMNFDFQEREIQFRLESNRDVSALLISFREKDEYLYIAGVNNNGVFFNFQIEEPITDRTVLESRNNIDIGTIFEKTMNSAKDLDNIQGIIQNNRITVEGPLTLHSLLADSKGNAFVLETDGHKNYICEGTKDFIVMTNFPNRDLAAKPFHEICGAGLDRYKLAYNYIQANKDAFDLPHAFEILKMTAQNKEHCKTICSMVFTPDTNEVYFSLNSDHNRIWKISIEKMILKTYKGFKDTKILNMNCGRGILSSELHRLSF